MIRFILSCILALSLVGSAPAMAAAAAQSSNSQAKDCAMTSGMPDRAMDHQKMPCCTADCTMTGAAAVEEPFNSDFSERVAEKAPLASAPVKQLDSRDWATVDPPPRA